MEFSILSDRKDIIEHEKNLYNNFFIRRNDSWTGKNYQVIDNCRLKPIIPYENLIIYAGKIDNKIIGSMSINYDWKNKFQTELIGFNIKKDQSICEGLNLYFNSDIKNIDFFSFFTSLYNELIKKNLLELKIKKIYSVCNKKLLNMYWLADWIIEDSLIKAEKEFFLISLNILKD